MGYNLVECVKVQRVSNGVTVGTISVNSSAVDMTGYDGCMFIVLFGNITDGTPAVKVQQDVSSGMGTAADLANTSVTCTVADDNKCLIVDVKKPTKGFLR